MSVADQLRARQFVRSVAQFLQHQMRETPPRVHGPVPRLPGELRARSWPSLGTRTRALREGATPSMDSLTAVLIAEPPR